MQVAAIFNFVEITERIATSGQPLAEDFSSIADAGYVAIINLARHDSDGAIANEGAIVAEQDMSYFHIPVRFNAPRKKELRQFIQLMKMLDRDKVWVHCVMNFRVSAFIYQYLKLACGYSEHNARSPIFDFWQPDPVWREVLQWSAEDIGLREH